MDSDEEARRIHAELLGGGTPPPEPEAEGLNYIPETELN